MFLVDRRHASQEGSKQPVTTKRIACAPFRQVGVPECDASGSVPGRACSLRGSVRERGGTSSPQVASKRLAGRSLTASFFFFSRRISLNVPSGKFGQNQSPLTGPCLLFSRFAERRERITGGGMQEGGREEGKEETSLAKTRTQISPGVKFWHGWSAPQKQVNVERSAHLCPLLEKM